MFKKPYSTSVKSFKERTVYCSKKCMHAKGETNVAWVGDKIQKDSLHCWIGREWGNPKKCDICGTTESPKFEWSNKNHTYKRNREDWQRLCKKCHVHYDIEYNGYIIPRNKT